MKKNLITSLKKLYAAFGGKDPTKDNAVDIVDKIADSVDNMDYPTIEEVDDELYQNWKGDYTYLNWNKYYTTNTNSLFKNNSLYHIPIYFGIENEMIVADDWFEYMTTTPSSNNANQNILENMWYACHVGFNNENGLLLKQSIKDMTVSTFINRIKNNIEQMVNANKIILTTTSYMVVRNPITSNNCIIGTRYYNDVNKYHFDILCDNRSGLGHISADYNVSDSTTTYSINYGVNLKPGTQYAGKIVGVDENGYYDYIEPVDTSDFAEKALVVTITENNNTFTADKTYTELYDAFLDRQIFCLYNGNYYSLTNASGTRIFFTDNSANPTSITISSDNSITVVE